MSQTAAHFRPCTIRGSKIEQCIIETCQSETGAVWACHADRDTCMATNGDCFSLINEICPDVLTEAYQCEATCGADIEPILLGQ